MKILFMCFVLYVFFSLPNNEGRPLLVCSSPALIFGKIPTPIKIKLALPPPPSKKTTTPPLKGGILWAWGFSSRKNPKMPGAHKIGAAISAPELRAEILWT